MSTNARASLSWFSTPVGEVISLHAELQSLAMFSRFRTNSFASVVHTISDDAKIVLLVIWILFLEMVFIGTLPLFPAQKNISL